MWGNKINNKLQGAKLLTENRNQGLGLATTGAVDQNSISVIIPNHTKSYQ